MQNNIRKAAVAGQFYDANPVRLRQYLDNLKQELSVDYSSAAQSAGQVRAVILPHAGYIYSAPTALKTLLTLGNRQYRRALVLAPSHHVGFQGIALSSADAFELPWGDMAVDTAAVQQLAAAESPLIMVHDVPHQHEHALEVELPLLYHLMPELKIIPGIVGFINSDRLATELAKLLLPLWQEDTLWVISSDFTHYGAAFNYVPFRDNIRDRLRELDLGAVELITQMDLTGFSSYLQRTGATICGAAPIKLLLAAINHLAPPERQSLQGELIDYTTSAEQSGDFSHCVSYAGIAFTDR